MRKYTELKADDIRQIPGFITEGLSPQEIANKFNVHKNTILSHIKRLRSLGVNITLRRGRRKLEEKLIDIIDEAEVSI